MKTKNRLIRNVVMTAGFCLLAAIYPLGAAAYTDGNPLQVTDEPEKLELQLGTEWAGTEFELKTDAGTFPVPVVVGEDGFLRMDLGGSQTYTLRILSDGLGDDERNDYSGAASGILPDEKLSDEETSDMAGSDHKDDTAARTSAIPPLHIILFVGGLVVCTATLIVMWNMKKRRLSGDEADEEEYDE